MTSRLRIGLLAEYPWSEEEMNRGGVIQANYQLVEALSRTDEIDLRVLAPTTRTATTVERRIGHGRIIYYPQPRHDFRFGFYPTLLKLRRMIRDMGIDLVHAQAHPHLIVPAQRAGLPSVVTIHGILRNELPVNKASVSWRHRLAVRTYARVEARYLARLRNVIAITPEIEQIVREVSPRARVFRVDNPIGQHFFELSDNSARPVILFVGWVVHRKGVHVLLEALAGLETTVPGIQIRIAGASDRDPTYVRDLETRFRRSIESGKVVFLGPISQERLYDEMSRCRLFCLPSLAESAPLVISQAMAAGKPIVASRVGGIPHMIADGVTGLLCKPNDSADLVRCLSELLGQPEKLREMGRLGRAVAERRHSFASVSSRTIEVYRVIAGANPRAMDDIGTRGAG